MRKSQPRAGFSSLRAGLAGAATMAAVLAATAAPAFAAPPSTFTVTPTSGPVGGGNTVAADATDLYLGATAPAARFIPGAATTCPTTYGTALTNSINATVTRDNADEGDITVPAVLFGTSYRICLYQSSATAATLQSSLDSTAPYTVTTATPTLSPYAAAPGTTTTTATGTGAFLTGTTTPAVTFLAAGTACPSTYNTTAATSATATKNTAGTAVTITLPLTLTLGSTYNVCIFAGNVANTSALLGSSRYSVVPSPTLSPNVGPTGGTNTVSVSSATPFLTNAVTTPGAIFTRNDCPNVYATGTGREIGTTSKVTNSRVAVVVPSGVALTGQESSAVYKLCLYTGTTGGSSTLVTQPLTYTVAPAVAVTSVDVSSGPAQGGQTVTIIGTGFPTAPDAAVSAAIGGSALQQVRVQDSTHITGVTTSHAPGAAAVSVTTLAGTKSTAGTPYTYTFGITVTPNTAVPSSTPTLYVTGAGFTGISFTNTAPASTGGRVFLVTNDWYGTATGGAYDTTPVTKCGGVVVISDTELLCTLDLANTLDATGAVVSPAVPVAAGTYTLAVVADAAASSLTTSQFSNVSSGSTFTVAEY